ncbi:Hypothetical predicted protein [Marmota monax]|uniref:Uncharacterized protein n=1 Tax=Marmota monax TaxID=9995 RepID=A0A5E4A1V8_MARMO|nr:Hypothetical predicted protein [Marmota monax]
MVLRKEGKRWPARLRHILRKWGDRSRWDGRKATVLLISAEVLVRGGGLSRPTQGAASVPCAHPLPGPRPLQVVRQTWHREAASQGSVWWLRSPQRSPRGHRPPLSIPAAASDRSCDLEEPGVQGPHLSPPSPVHLQSSLALTACPAQYLKFWVTQSFLPFVDPYFCVDAEDPGLQAQYGRTPHPGLAALPGSTAVGELRDPAHLSQVPCSELAFVPLERALGTKPRGRQQTSPRTILFPDPTAPGLVEVCARGFLPQASLQQAQALPPLGPPRRFLLCRGPACADDESSGGACLDMASTLVNIRGKFSRRKAEERGSHRAREPGKPPEEEASEPPRGAGHGALPLAGLLEPWHSQVPHRPESQVPVICDYGSGFSKLGFAGCEAPYAVFPTVLGKLRHDTMSVGMEEEDWFIEDEVQNKRGILNLQYPISRGAITNWDTMEKIWHHSFYHVLSIAPEEHPLMVTEPPLSKTSTKEKVTQILFETFGVPALYIGNQGVLSLYSSGQTSGTTIESGEGMTYFVPIIDGCPLLQSTTQMNVAGQDLTMYLMQLLAQEGNLLVSTGDPEFVRDIKEKCCYVALDFNKEKSKDNLLSCQNKFLLPDGQEITLRQEHFLCPEVLFQPSLIERNSLGMPMTVFRCISSCHPRQWKTLFHHIILSGGTGSCSGLRSRLQREIANLVCPAHDIQVYTSPCAKYGAWVGGSILCSLSTFEDMWVTNKEYEDMGSSVVRRRSI